MADNLLTPCLVIQATEAMAAMEMEDMAAMEVVCVCERERERERDQIHARSLFMCEGDTHTLPDNSKGLTTQRNILLPSHPLRHPPPLPPPPPTGPV